MKRAREEIAPKEYSAYSSVASEAVTHRSGADRGGRSTRQDRTTTSPGEMSQW